ncbi:MAG: hypothetical protein P1P89_08920 [Desulfobacterales bacterium]|nr:hypothetical protein [Desulfobacterales bacterium]
MRKKIYSGLTATTDRVNQKSGAAAAIVRRPFYSDDGKLRVVYKSDINASKCVEPAVGLQTAIGLYIKIWLVKHRNTGESPAGRPVLP